MEELSLTQKYALCAADKKGRLFPNISARTEICLVAAALLDLEDAGAVSLDGDKVRIAGDLPEKLSYLAPVYESCRRADGKRITEAYMELGVRNETELWEATGTALAKMGLAERQKGFLGGNSRYVPDRKAVQEVAEEMRAELLEDGPVTEDSAALAALLDKSNRLDRYFSDFERKELKDKLKKAEATGMGRSAADTVKLIDDFIAAVTALLVTAMDV
ncbi:MAG: GOLPH3/VPS74 family protein [Oscillospiraceae bacterium]|jgi:hypothetical protein